MTLSEVAAISGEAGNFEVTIKEHPRYVDMDKCIACGECTTKCPKKVASEYDAATGKRKAPGQSVDAAGREAEARGRTVVRLAAHPDRPGSTDGGAHRHPARNRVGDESILLLTAAMYSRGTTPPTMAFSNS